MKLASEIAEAARSLRTAKGEVRKERVRLYEKVALAVHYGAGAKVALAEAGLPHSHWPNVEKTLAKHTKRCVVPGCSRPPLVKDKLVAAGRRQEYQKLVAHSNGVCRTCGQRSKKHKMDRRKQIA